MQRLVTIQEIEEEKYSQSVSSRCRVGGSTTKQHLLTITKWHHSNEHVLQPSWHPWHSHALFQPHPPMARLWVALTIFVQQLGASQAFLFPTKQKSQATKPEEQFSRGGECDYPCWSWSQVEGCCSSRAWGRVSGGQETVLHRKLCIHVLFTAVWLTLDTLLLFY